MAYKIEYFYRTGNTFGHEELTETLEMSWDKLEKEVTACVRRTC